MDLDTRYEITNSLQCSDIMVINIFENVLILRRYILKGLVDKCDDSCSGEPRELPPPFCHVRTPGEGSI